MNLKTVIRIEHSSNNVGLFKYRFENYESIKAYVPDLVERHCRNFPDLFNDCFKFNYDWEGDLFLFNCAFLSIEQMNQWITKEEMKEIIKLGFKILLLEVSKWGESDYQVIFKKENIVSSKNITSLFETIE